MAKWTRRWFPEPKIVGSSPTWDASCLFLEGTRTHKPRPPTQAEGRDPVASPQFVNYTPVA